MRDDNRNDDYATGDPGAPDIEDLEIKSEEFRFAANPPMPEAEWLVAVDYELTTFRGGDYMHTIYVGDVPVHVVYDNREDAQRWVYDVLDGGETPPKDAYEVGLALGAFKTEYDRLLALGEGDYMRGHNIDRHEKSKRAAA